HGLTVLAQGVSGPVGLEVDATYAYFANDSTISRIALAGGGSPVVMVSHVQPAAMGITNDSVIWADRSLAMQTVVMSAPLTATGWVGPTVADGGTSSGDAGTPTSDASIPTNDASPPTSDASTPTSDANPPTSDARPPTSDAGTPTATVLATLPGNPGAF